VAEYDKLGDNDAVLVKEAVVVEEYDGLGDREAVDVVE
jgi:hypothetical protein